jgi:hypothetical protein
MTTTMVRGRVCLRGLSSVLQLELCSASFPASLPIVATTSPRRQVIRYPLSRHPSCVQATATAKTSSPRGPKSLPPTCWSRRTPSGSSARLTSSARTGPPNDLVLRSWIDSSDLMAVPAKVPGQSPQLGFSMVIGRQRTETPYLLQNPNSVHRFQEHPPWIASPRASVECRDLSKGASGSPDRALAGTSISQGRPAGAARCHEN